MDLYQDENNLICSPTESECSNGPLYNDQVNNFNEKISNLNLNNSVLLDF